MPRLVRARLRLSAALVLGMAALSCSSCGAPQQKVFPVQGKVLFDGRAAEGAYVFFHPVENKQFTKGDQPRGSVGADGCFRISTYKPDDGAPPGKYIVTVYWAPKAAGSDDADTSPFLRYLSPETSPFQAEVKEAPTMLDPFVLSLDNQPGRR